MNRDRKFLAMTQVASDSTAQLRRCDVMRVLESSGLTGTDLHELGGWLIEKRPDLTGEVRECLEEVAAA